MAKVFVIPVLPQRKSRRDRDGGDPKYIDGQRVLVNAMKYLAKQDLQANRGALELLSEHFRTQFRMSDRPEQE